MNIIILGPQGSGKGTQAIRLAEKYNLFYFEAGAYLREIAKTRPDIDSLINKRGVLIDDQTMFGIVSDYLNEKKVFENILFDGYPRSVAQYDLLTKLLAEHNQKIDKVFFLQISDQEAIKRLSARRQDAKTGQIYNLITNPPDESVNPADLIQREDDTPAAITQRLQKYHEVTQPLVELFKEQGLLVEVDGTLPIEEIAQILSSEVEKINK